MEIWPQEEEVCWNVVQTLFCSSLRTTHWPSSSLWVARETQMFHDGCLWAETKIIKWGPTSANFSAICQWWMLLDTADFPFFFWHCIWTAITLSKITVSDRDVNFQDIWHWDKKYWNFINNWIPLKQKTEIESFDIDSLLMSITEYSATIFMVPGVQKLTLPF